MAKSLRLRLDVGNFTCFLITAGGKVSTLDIAMSWEIRLDLAEGMMRGVTSCDEDVDSPRGRFASRGTKPEGTPFSPYL